MYFWTIIIPVVFAIGVVNAKSVQTNQNDQLYEEIPQHGKIVGGYEVVPYSIPFQVSIQTTFGSNYCGGSVYDENTILSAAHCFNGVSADSVKVVVGEHNLDLNEGFEQEVLVREIISHELFDPIAITPDIALLKLQEPLKFKTGDGAVGPVTLPVVTDAFPTGTVATVSGWGVTESGSPSNVLLAVDVKVNSDEECREGYQDQYQPFSMICASETGKDSCQLDSGGPLTCGPDRKQCGIVSFGQGCALAGYPGIYTRITSYLEWIETHA